jgi:hypothetical protein
MHKNPLVFGLLYLALLLISTNSADAQFSKSKNPSALEKLVSGKDASLAADVLEKMYDGNRQPESVKMLVAILRGSQMGPGEGWFGPSESRYSWKWLAKECKLETPKKGISRKDFSGTDAVFSRLDRNKNGAITPDDLDWSDQNPYIQMSYMVNRLFRRMEPKGTGKLTKEDLTQFFEKAAQGKEYLTSDDLRDALLGGMSSGGFTPGDAPTKDVLIRGLFAGEIGSMNEGPHVDQLAPNFTLKTVDRKDSVQLSKLIGTKPVVLVFGNFTCGPFRSYYPEVETVYDRYKKDAHFLMIYVREAHPSNGWKMESNTKVGVEVSQPTDFEERVKVAGQFCERLKTTIPVVVDEINDVVGHAYSGMPARMYVIDTEGKVAYKSGRGPFGFRVGEMEQALLMALFEQQVRGKSSSTSELKK